MPPFPPISPKILIALITSVIILAGVGAGYLISRSTSTSVASGVINTAKEVGSTDTKTFRDSAQGVIEKGGINGEGTHKLVRDGGPSQTVYLVSSVVDLDQFDSKKAEVWGETVKAQKAGWLMDVGRVKLLE